jgi:ribonuclease T2
MSPASIEAAFSSANNGLENPAMATICHGGLFREIRICLDKTLRFRACREVDADACPARSLSIPPAG